MLHRVTQLLAVVLWRDPDVMITSFWPLGAGPMLTGRILFGWVLNGFCLLIECLLVRAQNSWFCVGVQMILRRGMLLCIQVTPMAKLFWCRMNLPALLSGLMTRKAESARLRALVRLLAMRGMLGKVVCSLVVTSVLVVLLVLAMGEVLDPVCMLKLGLLQIRTTWVLVLSVSCCTLGMS